MDTVGEFISGICRPRFRRLSTPHLAQLPAKRPTGGIRRPYPMLLTPLLLFLADVGQLRLDLVDLAMQVLEHPVGRVPLGHDDVMRRPGPHAVAEDGPGVAPVGGDAHLPAAIDAALFSHADHRSRAVVAGCTLPRAGRIGFRVAGTI